MHRSLRRGALAVAALTTLLAAAPAAQARTVELDGGTTTLRLDASAARALSSLGVAVAPVSPSRARSTGITFPITGGAVRATDARGRITHDGGLRLRAGGTTVALRDFTIAVRADHSTISAAVGDDRVSPFLVDLSDAELARTDGGVRVSGVVVRLSGVGARALNRAFGTDALRRGLRLGVATVDARTDDVLFTGGATSLAVDAGTAGALTQLGISVRPISGATASGATFSFPVRGGAADPTTLAGEVLHSGGLRLQGRGATVDVVNFTIDTAPTPVLDVGLVGAGRAPLANLDLSGLQRSTEGSTLVLGNVGLTLTKAAADALDQAFSTTAFQEGLRLGTATVRAELG
jgi:hypothetical protein